MPGSRDLEPKSDGEERARSRPELEDEAEPSFFAQPRRIAQTLLIVLILVAAIYVLLPKIVGLDDALATLDKGNPWWIALAVVFNVAAFAAYVALFRGVVGEKVLHLEWKESYQITMAGLAATRLFSAGGAGGILLTYWALRKAGMERRQSVCRMVAFLVVLYSVYLAALVIFGVLLRTHVVSGEAPLSGTLIPAALAAIAFVRHPSSGAMAFGGAIGFWGANIAILWASFHAFNVSVPLAVVIQGFFLGMLANLFPFAPGGVGAVDAGMIGAFVLFGIPGAEVFAAVLTYRVIAFWLPIPPGIVAFFQLRNTVRRWEREGRERPDRLDVGEAETAAARS